MKKQLVALILASLLLTGCRNTQNKSNQSGNSSGDPTDYGYEFYDGYYGELKWSNSEDLKQKLHDIIRNGYTALTYNKSGHTNWETNTYADHTKEYFEYLDVVYSSTDVLATDTNKAWQREHAFAATLMTGSGTGDAVKFLGRSTDFHNLFASNASANGSRGNKNYGMADPNASGYQDKTTNNGKDGYKSDSKTFEPGDVDKGRLSRALFYMATMYKDDEQDTRNNVLMKGLKIVEEPVEYVAGNNCAFAIGNLSTLLDWNKNFDVDYLEMQHNESVYSHVFTVDEAKQGNRNPYVDYPGLVDYVYGDKQNDSGDLKNIKPSCVVLESNKDELSHYALKSAKRQFGYGDTLTLNDFKVLEVNKNYSTKDCTTGFTHNYLDHVFTPSDGSSVEAVISAGQQQLKYTIDLDPMKACSFFSEMKKAGIASTYASIGEDNNVTYGGKNFVANVIVDYGSADHSTDWTIKDRGEGGFLMGSGTYKVTSFTLTSASSYTVDKVYMSCRVGNQSSSYTLKIKIGSDLVYSGTINNKDQFVIMGTTLDTAHTGVITYTFEGTNCLWLQNIAFNEVEA